VEYRFPRSFDVRSKAKPRWLILSGSNVFLGLVEFDPEHRMPERLEYLRLRGSFSLHIGLKRTGDSIRNARLVGHADAQSGG